MPTYVYGITQERLVPSADRGVGGGEVRTLTEDGLSAVVGTVADGPVEANRANLTAHSDVLQEVVSAGAVAPMRFGIVLDDDDAVRDELLRARRDDLLGLLAGVGAHVEFSLRAYYVEDAILADILATTPAVSRLRASIRSLPEAATYYDRIRLGELVAAELQRRRAADAASLLRALQPLAVDTRTADDLPDRIVARLSFLVERDGDERFREAVDAAAREREARMTLKLTGPLPPFSFVDLEVGARTPAAIGERGAE